ncbi:MAG: SRPBCC domain-containing protein [Gilvibacter sp.]
MKTSNPPIILEYNYSANVKELWAAITDHSQMLQWFFDNIPSFKPVKGFKTQFMVKSEDRQFTHVWEVTAVVPYHSICYTWQYPEYEGFATVCFKIDATGQGSRLVLELTVKRDFPDGIPEFKRDSCIAGWNYFLGQNLAQYLSKDE